MECHGNAFLEIRYCLGDLGDGQTLIRYLLGRLVFPGVRFRDITLVALALLAGSLPIDIHPIVDVAFNTLFGFSGREPITEPRGCGDDPNFPARSAGVGIDLAYSLVKSWPGCQQSLGSFICSHCDYLLGESELRCCTCAVSRRL